MRFRFNFYWMEKEKVWYFYSMYGHDFMYDPQTHLIMESWLYTCETHDGERTMMIRPMDLDLTCAPHPYSPTMPEAFRELLTYLSRIHP